MGDSATLLGHVCSKSFHEFDIDQNGSLELHEVEVLVQSISRKLKVTPPSGDEVRRLFASSDVSHTNSLQKDEFVTFFKGLLEIMQKRMCSTATKEINVIVTSPAGDTVGSFQAHTQLPTGELKMQIAALDGTNKMQKDRAPLFQNLFLSTDDPL